MGIFFDQFVADRGPTVNAGIIVFFAFLKNQQQSLSDGYRFLASGTKQFGGVKISIGFSHDLMSFSGIVSQFFSQMSASLSLGAR